MYRTVGALCATLTLTATTGTPATADPQPRDTFHDKACVDLGGVNGAELCARSVLSRHGGRLATRERTLHAINCHGAFEDDTQAHLSNYRVESMTRSGRTHTLHYDPDPSDLAGCRNVYDKTYATRRPCILVTWQGLARLDWAPDKQFSLYAGTGPCNFPDSWAQRTTGRR